MQRRTTVKSRRSDELEDPELADAGMTNVVRNLAAGIPRTLAGRVGLLTLLGLVFLLSAALQLARPCTPHPALDATDLSTYGDSGKTLVVMVFAGNQLKKTIAALERWETMTPCSSEATKAQATLMLYTDGDLAESGTVLKNAIKGLASVKKCFQQVSYASALLKDEDNVYNKKRENHLWVRGPNQLFYNMMLKILPGDDWVQSGVSHLFWMEPDNVPQHNNWLEHLMAKGKSGPYWIQGSSYRGDCIPEEGGNCTLIGRAIRGHLNGNALYHVGDPSFMNFVKEVSEGEWQHWPFDLAMWKEVQESWPEPRFRQNVHLLQFVDWIRNYGPYPWKPEDLPSHVLFVHADAKPAIDHEFRGTFTEAETDVAEKAKAQAAEETAWLRQEVERLKAELAARTGGTSQKASGDAVSARLAQEETRRILLPAPETEGPVEPGARSTAPGLAAAATPEGNILLAVVSAANAPMLENYVALVERAGAARHLVLVPLDATGGAAANALGRRVGAIVPGNGTGNASHWSARLQALVNLLKQGYGVVAADVDDVAWLRDPFLGFSSEYELQVPVDARHGTRESSRGREYDPFVSADLHYSRPTPAVIQFWEGLLKAFEADPEAGEDVLLSDLLKQAGANLKWGSLEPALFPNGPLFFEERLPQVSGVDPIALHNNWVSPRSKLYRFREAGLWLTGASPLGPKPGTKYLTYFDAIEENGLNNQRQAFRNALAIARILNRTLIMPTFHRRHRVESPVPMDYFFDFDKFDAEFPGVEPHHFLEEAFPEWETLPVQVMDVAIPPVPSAAPWINRAVIVKPKREWHGATVAELLGWYGASEEPLLVFHGLFRRFDKFETLSEHARFNRQIHRALVPIPRTMEIAEYVSNAVAEASPTRHFDCFHLRHSKEFQEGQAQWGTVRPLEEIVQLLVAKLPPSENTLYLTTDVPTKDTRDAFLAGGYASVAFLRDHFPAWEMAHVQTREGEVTMREGQIDQLVCSRARTFIGNEYSTFTSHIAFLREQAGLEQVSEDIYDRDRQEMEYL